MIAVNCTHKGQKLEMPIWQRKCTMIGAGHAIYLLKDWRSQFLQHAEHTPRIKPR